MVCNYRAVGRSENSGVSVLFGGHNLTPLVEIGITDLPKSVGANPWHLQARDNRPELYKKRHRLPSITTSMWFHAKQDQSYSNPMLAEEGLGGLGFAILNVKNLLKIFETQTSRTFCSKHRIAVTLILLCVEPHRSRYT